MSRFFDPDVPPCRKVSTEHIKFLYNRYINNHISKVFCNISLGKVFKISPPPIKIVKPEDKNSIKLDEQIDDTYIKGRQLLSRLLPITSYIKDVDGNDYIVSRTESFFSYIIDYADILGMDMELFVFDFDVKPIKTKIDYKDYVNSVIKLEYDFKYLIKIPCLDLSLKLYNMTIKSMENDIDNILNQLSDKVNSKRNEFDIAKANLTLSQSRYDTAKHELIYVKMQPTDYTESKSPIRDDDIDEE